MKLGIMQPYLFPYLGYWQLLAAVDQALPFDPLSVARFRFPMAEGANVSLLHQLGRVMETEYDETGCRIVAEVPESVRERLKQFLEVTH